MIFLDDETLFHKTLSIEVPWSHSYADMRVGKTDRERRENFRAAAVGKIIAPRLAPRWWAFRISVTKARRSLDVDNVAKTIIDAFCTRQIARDGSSFVDLGLYPDDSFDHVRFLQVGGQRGPDATRIEIFGCISDDGGVGP